MAIRHANIAEAAAKYTGHDKDRSGSTVARGLSSSGLGLCLTPVGEAFSVKGPVLITSAFNVSEDRENVWHATYKTLVVKKRKTRLVFSG